MLVYAGKEITAAVQGRRLECVTCDHCQMRFYYELVRVGAGKGSAPFFLGQQSAADRAGKAAEKQLGAASIRKPNSFPAQSAIGSIRILSTAIAMASTPARSSSRSSSPSQASSPRPSSAWRCRNRWAITQKRPAVVSAAIGILRCFLRSSCSSSAIACGGESIPICSIRVRRPFPPAPLPALIERRSPDSKTVVLKPVLRSNPTDQGGPTPWAVFRPGQIRFPDLCVVCLAPAKVLYDPPFKVNQTSEIAVPLCTACARNLTRRWWITGLIVSAIALGSPHYSQLSPPGLMRPATGSSSASSRSSAYSSASQSSPPGWAAPIVFTLSIPTETSINSRPPTPNTLNCSSTRSTFPRATLPEAKFMTRKTLINGSPVRFQVGSILVLAAALGTASCTPRQELQPVVARPTLVAPPKVSTTVPEQVMTLGQSVEGRDIVIHIFGHGAGGTLIIGGIHGNEPTSATVAEDLIACLRNQTNGGERVAVIPSANPDGLVRGLRTNKNLVDLNRNFPAANWAKTRKGVNFGGEPPRANRKPRQFSKHSNGSSRRASSPFTPWKSPVIIMMAPPNPLPKQ